MGIDAEMLPKTSMPLSRAPAPTSVAWLVSPSAKRRPRLIMEKLPWRAPGAIKARHLPRFFPWAMPGRTVPWRRRRCRLPVAMRVLLVEDHEDTNRSLTQLLRRRGYQVQAVHSVHSALDAADKEEFDVLVSDIGLPDGSGIELMEKLQSAHPMAGIALTGFGMEEDLRRSQEVGFNHHLVKPVDLNRLDALRQQVGSVREGVGASSKCREALVVWQSAQLRATCP